MNRRVFLHRLGLLAGAVALGRLPQGVDEAPALELEPTITTSTAWAAGILEYRPLVASSGGLCAPVSPYYQVLHPPFPLPGLPLRGIEGTHLAALAEERL